MMWYTMLAILIAVAGSTVAGRRFGVTLRRLESAPWIAFVLPMPIAVAVGLAAAFLQSVWPADVVRPQGSSSPYFQIGTSIVGDARTATSIEVGGFAILFGWGLGLFANVVQAALRPPVDQARGKGGDRSQDDTSQQ